MRLNKDHAFIITAVLLLLPTCGSAVALAFAPTPQAVNLIVSEAKQQAPVLAKETTAPTIAITTPTVPAQSPASPNPKPAVPVAAPTSKSTTHTSKLNLAYFHQPYNQSCEETDLRMVLGYYGIITNELDIVGRVGYAPKTRDKATNSWDDPNTMFVGDINGWQNSTGYGVYSEPLARAARSFGRQATAYRGVSAQFIAATIARGKPVIVWGSSGKAKLDGWNTDHGVVQAWVSEHTRVVIGISGSADAPIGFYLHDSLFGGPNMYWSTSQLMANMNQFGNLSNQAVVVE